METSQRIILHAARDAHGLGVRAGETIVVHESGQVFATRRLEASPADVRAALDAGVLVLPRPHLALTV